MKYNLPTGQIELAHYLSQLLDYWISSNGINIQTLKKNQAVFSVQILDDNGKATGLFRYGEVRQPWDRSNISTPVVVWHPTLHLNMSYDINRIYVRKLESLPILVVSDTKHHDSAFVRHYLDIIFLGPDGWVQKQNLERRMKNHFLLDEIVICSDGAASQFKQKCTLYICTLLKDKYSWIKRLTWSFGAPGHGKGTWDGLRGMSKNTLKRKIICDNLNFKSPREVFHLLEELFTSEKEFDLYKKAKDIKIKLWDFYYVEEEVLKHFRDEAAILNKQLRLIGGLYHN